MISIIMPVYNAGEYLFESIPSILTQTYKDFELICVDDCSDDNITAGIIQGFLEKDGRIKAVQTRNNGGAGKARNYGMSFAQGEHLIFLDADDIFDRGMLEKMANCIKRAGADVCVCGHRKVDSESGKIVEEIIPIAKPGVTDRAFNLGELGEEGLQYWIKCSSNVLCRRSFVEGHNIAFLDASSYEDMHYACLCAIYAEKIAYCESGKPLFSYRVGHGTQNTAHRHPMDTYKVISAVMEKAKAAGDTDLYRQLICILLGSSIEALDTSPYEEEKKEYYIFLRSFLLKNRDKIVFANKYLNKRIGYFLAESYESRWFEAIGDFEKQLRAHWDEMDPKIQKFQNGFVVWGNGKRGRAFQRLCCEKGYKDVWVTDRGGIGAGKKTQSLFPFLTPEQARHSKLPIVASNRAIFQALSDGCKADDTDLMDIEQYCPIE